MSEPAVSLWLKGVHNPHLDKIKRIAELLDLSFAELVGDDDAICQDQSELDTLRALRSLDPMKKEQLQEFIVMSAKGFELPPPPENK